MDKRSSWWRKLRLMLLVTLAVGLLSLRLYLWFDAGSPGISKPSFAKSGSGVVSLPVLENPDLGWYPGLVYSPDGKQLVSAGSDGMIRIWDSLSGKELLVLKGHDGLVSFVTFSNGGKRLATGGMDKTIKVWDVATWKEIKRFDCGSLVNKAAFHPDGRSLVSADSDGAVRLWSLDSGQASVLYRNPVFPITSVAFHPNGLRLFFAGWDQTVWTLRLGEQQQISVLYRHNGPVYDLAVSPNGAFIASAGSEGKIKVWDTGTGWERMTFASHQSSIYSLAFDFKSQMLASAGDDGSLKIWDLDFYEIFSFNHLPYPIGSVAFRPDGQQVATSNLGGFIKAWNIGSSQDLFDNDLNEIGIDSHSLRFTPDGKSVTFVGLEKQLKMFDLAKKQTHILANDFSRSHRFYEISPNGERIARGDFHGVLRVWETKPEPKIIEFKEHLSVITAMVFHPSGELLASMDTMGLVKVWNLRTRKAVYTFEKGHSGQGSDLCFSPDGQLLACSSGEDIQVWSMTAGQKTFVKKDFPNARSVSFSPDGKLLAASSSDEGIKIWEVGSGKEMFSNQSWHGFAKFSPNGKYWASAGSNYVAVWETSTGQKIHDFRSHGDNSFTGVVFHPDGKRLFTTEFSFVSVWDLESGKEKILFKTLGARNIVIFSPNGNECLARPISSGRAWLWDLNRLQTPLIFGERD